MRFGKLFIRNLKPPIYPKNQVEEKKLQRSFVSRLEHDVILVALQQSSSFHDLPIQIIGQQTKTRQQQLIRKNKKQQQLQIKKKHSNQKED